MTEGLLIVSVIYLAVGACFLRWRGGPDPLPVRSALFLLLAWPLAPAGLLGPRR